jgi:lipid-A-disaccharide synthase
MKVFLSAGEASGDQLGAGLAQALRRRCPEVELIGMGGREMQAAAVEIVQPAKDVAVVGLVEVLSKLPVIRGAMKRLEHALDERRPDLLVTIDFPDFNLRLAARARRRGIPVVHFVSPKVWAWRKGRVQTIKERIDRMLVLFPFEAEIYEEAGVPVTFVGHPLVDRILPDLPVDEIRSELSLDPDRRWVGMLPGSRTGEVTRVLPVMLAAARRLVEEVPDAGFVLPRASTLPLSLLNDLLADADGLDVRVVENAYPRMLGALDAAWVASGTASLETALAGVPLSIVYRVHPLTYALGRMMVNIDHVGLPNLVAEERIVPERIQSECRAEILASDMVRLLTDEEEIGRQKRALFALRERLGESGAFDRAALALAPWIDRCNEHVVQSGGGETK